MAVLPEEVCYALKNMADPLFLLSLADQYALSGQVIGNGLVFALLEEKRSGDERDIIKFCLSYDSRRSHNAIVTCLFHRLVYCINCRASRAMCT